MPGRLRLSGTFELGGFDLTVDERRVDAIERTGARRIHGLADRRRLGVWRGLRPCTPDGLPLVGRTARYENLLLATGHAALGFTLAPITGALVAQLVAGEQTEHDIALLRPDRFHGLVRRRAGRRG